MRKVLIALADHVLGPALHDEGAKPFSAAERALPEPPEGCPFNGAGNRILSTQLAAAFPGSGD